MRKIDHPTGIYTNICSHSGYPFPHSKKKKGANEKMKVREIVEAMIEERGITKSKLGRRIGHASGSSLSQSLARDGGLTTQTLRKICEAMDYEIVVRKRNYLRQVEGEMILDE